MTLSTKLAGFARHIGGRVSEKNADTIDALVRVAEALEMALKSIGLPSGGSFEGLHDADVITVAYRIQIGDIRKMRNALAALEAALGEQNG